MTILQPNNRFQFNLNTVIWAGLAIAVVSLNIYFYSNIVNLRHRLTQESKDLQSAQVLNANYKNELYKALDFASLKNLSGQLNLVKTKPSYLEVGVSVAANGPR